MAEDGVPPNNSCVVIPMRILEKPEPIVNDKQRVDNWLDGLSQQDDLPGTTNVNGPLSMLRLLRTEIEKLRELLMRIRKEAENESSEIEFAHWAKAVIDHGATEVE